MTALQIIDDVSIVAPFGVCFHDAATGQRVVDGLKVSVFPATAKVLVKSKEAHPNRTGVYVLQKIAVKEGFERGAGDQQFWDNNPPDKLFTVKVSDNQARFQPFQFSVRLPVKGLYKWENLPPASPNKSLSSIPLYSAPARSALGGMSVVRAQLRQPDGIPAAWAVLEANFDGKMIARGIADSEGRIALIFPSLPPQTEPFASPPASATRVSLAEQKWVLEFNLKYQPGIFQSSPPRLSESDGEIFPDLRLVLAQANGTLWADSGQTEEFETAVLKLGNELILRSREAGVLSPMPDTETAFSSFLFVSPAS